MNELKKNKTKEMILVSFILIISFAVWLVVPYAQHLANGRDIEWNYYIGKGIIVSFVSLAVYLLAAKYGYSIFEKHSKAILYIGTTTLLVFAIFEFPLSHIETPVLSKAILYIYSALPFLELITLCAFTVSLNDILSDDFTLTKVALVATGFVMAFLLNNVLKVVLLIMLITVLIKQLKNKDNGKKTVFIIVTVLSICLLAYVVYAFCIALKTLLIEWDNKSYMAYVSRYVWSNTKLFGTMDNLKYLGGSTVFFSLLWMIELLGIVPTVIIVVALMLFAAMLLNKRKSTAQENPISILALIYFCVCSVIAVLANCGIFFNGFMTSMPLIMDTVAGMLCSFLLLGLYNTNLNVNEGKRKGV